MKFNTIAIFALFFFLFTGAATAASVAPSDNGLKALQSDIVWSTDDEKKKKKADEEEPEPECD